jgi:hypothetical protein
VHFFRTSSPHNPLTLVLLPAVSVVPPGAGPVLRAPPSTTHHGPVLDLALSKKYDSKAEDAAAADAGEGLNNQRPHRGGSGKKAKKAHSARTGAHSDASDGPASVCVCLCLCLCL